MTTIARKFRPGMKALIRAAKLRINEVRSQEIQLLITPPRSARWSWPTMDKSVSVPRAFRVPYVSVKSATAVKLSADRNGCVDYLLQAYELQPQDPLICLNLAVACVSRAMQRQADNRHSLILEVHPALKMSSLCIADPSDRVSLFWTSTANIEILKS